MIQVKPEWLVGMLCIVVTDTQRQTYEASTVTLQLMSSVIMHVHLFTIKNVLKRTLIVVKGGARN